MAEIVRRRSRGGVLPLGRHVSISGSSLIQCASVSIALSSFQEGQNAIPVQRFKVEQALVLEPKLLRAAKRGRFILTLALTESAAAAQTKSAPRFPCSEGPGFG